MRTSRVTLAALAVATIALTAPAEARRHPAPQRAAYAPTFDAAAFAAYPLGVRGTPHAPRRAAGHRAKGHRMARTSPKALKAIPSPPLAAPEAAAPERHRGSGLVSILCGPGHVKVAGSAATQFEGFCRELWAVYHWVKGQNGWRFGSCATGSKHPCGGAIDIEQWCRSCVTKAFPVKLAEKIADKWGLWPGSRWGYRDTGHFEIHGGLRSNGWKPKEAAIIAALPPEPAPKHWPMTLTETTPPPAPVTNETSKSYVAVETVLDRPAIALYPYEEIVEEKPAKVVLASLRDIPIGTPRQEVDRAADAFGIDRTLMRAIARIESDFDPRERTGQYVGVFQLSRHEFASFGEGSITNARDNSVAAAAKFVSERADFESIVHRDADRGDLYLVHQQGIGGAVAHLQDPDRVAWRSMCTTDEGREKGARWCRKAIWGNVLPAIKRAWKSVENLTSGAFVAMWRDRVETFYRGGDEALSTKIARIEHHARVHHRHHHYRLASR